MFFNKYIKYKRIVKITKTIKKIELTDFEQLKKFYTKMALLITTVEDYHKDMIKFNVKQKTILTKDLLDIMVMYNKIINPFMNTITVLINNDKVSDQTRAGLIEYAKSNMELSENIVKTLDSWVAEVL